MMPTRNFHLGDILSVTTGRLVSPRHMDGIYDILNFMTGEAVWTHQLPRVAQEMTPRLLAQHPDLKEIMANEVTPENHTAWLAEQVAKYGETRAVTPAHQFHEIRDPIAELEEMVGLDRVILVRP